MPTPVRFSFIAETAQAVRETLGYREALESVRTAARETASAATVSAREQVAALVQQREALRTNLAEYGKLAAAARHGSEEQIAANKLAADSARQLGVAYEAAGIMAAGAAKKAAEAQVAAAATAREESALARGFASRTVGVSAFAGGAFLVGAAAGLLAKKAADEAQRAQESQTQLATAMHAVGLSYDAQRGKIEEYLAAQEKLSTFDRVELRTGFTSLIRVTQDAGKAQDLLSQATDVARGRHIGLNQAVMILTRAYQGNVGMLRRMGIDVPAVTTAQDKLRAAHVKATPELTRQAKELDKQATSVKALALLQERYAGAAETHAKTLAGHEEALGNAFRELAVTIGTAITPQMTRLVGGMTSAINRALESKRVHEDLRQVFHFIGGVIHAVWTDVVLLAKGYEYVAGVVHSQVVPALAIGLVLAIRAVIAAMQSAEASVPWLAIATGAIIAATWIIQHWGEVKKFLDKLWTDVKAAANAAWTFIEDLAKEAAFIIAEYATAGIRAILEVAAHLPFVGGKARAALNDINSALDTLKPDWHNVAESWNAGFDRAGKAGYDAANAWLSRINGAVSGVAGSIGAPVGGPVGGSTTAKAMSGGTTFAVVNQARRLGVGSGGIYRLGGGHGGVATPGTMLDCSGYVYQVFTQSGFRGFPGVSSTQWSTHSGPNWTSVVIDPSVARPGDVVFMVGADPPSPGHVGIVVSGSGMGAVVMQYYRSGLPPDTISMSAINDLVGVKRYYLVVKGASAGSPKPPPSTNTSAAFDAALAAAPKRAAKAGSKGLSAPSEIGIQGAITALLRTVPSETDSIERDAIAHIKKIRDSLHVGMSSTDLAKDRVELAKWGKTLKDEIRKNANEARAAARHHANEVRKAAREAAAAFSQGWTMDVHQIDRAIAEAWAIVQRNFDRETQAHLLQMNRDTRAGLTALQRTFAQQMTQFDRETQRGLESFNVAQTPEEQALAAFQANRSAQDQAERLAGLQDALAQAQTGGDPAAILQAQKDLNNELLDEQEASLQKRADDSRKAQDALTTQQQQDYQDQRDALKQSLSDQEAILEQSYQDTADAAAQAYQDQRDAQWQHLNDVHDDQVTAFDADLANWGTWIGNKSKTWYDFLVWFAQNQPSLDMPTPPPGTQVAPGWSTATQPGGGVAVHNKVGIGGKMAKGGDFLVSRPTLFMAGEEGPERATFTPIGRNGPGAGGGVHIGTLTVIGTTEREVANALARIVTPAQRRQVGFTAAI